MNSLARVFSNFREFYSEINGATLTGAIDVIVVEQQDGSYMCSPFHVRFGKLGVLRSREKIVDIEVNGEPVDIHMKLGESGEAFFVVGCDGDDVEIPVHMATSPIPVNNFLKYEENLQNDAEEKALQLPLPRRNSIDFSKEIQETEGIKFENQTSTYRVRRHTDNAMDRSHLTSTKLEYTTQKLRQEWAEQDPFLKMDGLEENDDSRRNSIITGKDDLNVDSQHFRPIPVDETILLTSDSNTALLDKNVADEKIVNGIDEKSIKDDSKGKKKRRKKSIMKKKNSQRKTSVSSSTGSANSDQIEAETESVTISNNTESSNDGSPKSEDVITITPSDESVPILPDSLNASDIKNKTEPPSRLLDIHFFSDTEVGSGLSPGGSRPSSPVQSDTEFEVSQRDDVNNVMTNSASWKWGELPTQPEINPNSSSVSKEAQRNSMLSGMFSFMKNSRRKNAPEGVYLSELESESMDPEVAALYFPDTSDQINSLNHNEDDRESGNGTSLPQSPTSMEGLKSLDSDFDEMKLYDKEDFVAMSLCGGMENGGPSDNEFALHQVKYSEVCQNPSLFASPNLVVRINRKYYTWSAACPIVMTLLTFQKPLPKEVCDQITNQTKISDMINLDNSQKLQQQESNKRSNSWWYWRRSSEKMPPNKDEKSIELDNSNNLEAATQTSRSNSREEIITENHIEKVKENDGYNGSMSSEDSDGGKNTIRDQERMISEEALIIEGHNEKFRKSLRLNSEQIESLNLKNGMNEIVFSVTTAYQGTSRCKCYLFKWKYNDKVVISDIDGTITKSDVLGHILPMVGKDWAQMGVAQLFSKIEENGYKLLYLSARAIGQSRATREYLRSIRQGDLKLPDGPLLLNPTSLISALHREVIERKPEQFKIACLSDIQALFPEKNPFYAGYGNRINDVWAYRAVGIPIMRIFTINPKGELKHEFTQTFQSTYCSMAFIVDQLFPPIKNNDEEDIEYTSFNYWRDPVPDIHLEVDLNVPTSELIKISDTVGIQQINLSKQLPTIPEN